MNSVEPRAVHPFEAAPHRTLVVLTVPVMLSLVAEPLAGLVDTAFVQRIGIAEAAALGAATVLLSGFIWIFNFLGIGTQTEVAHGLGEQKPHEARAIASLATILAIALGASSALVGWLVVEPASAWMSDDHGVRAGTETYLSIRLLGLPAALVQFTAFGALRGLQDMKTPLWIATGMSLLNIALDAVLIFGLGPIPALGIAGAAAATVVSQSLAAAVAIAVVTRRLGFTFAFELSRARALLVVGRDMVIRTGALLLFLVVSTRVALQLGPKSGAAHQAMRQMWMLIAFLLDAYAATAQSLIGYFIGAGRPQAARRVAKVALGWGVSTGLALAIVLLLAERGVAMLLVPVDASKEFAAAWFVFALSQPLNAISFVTDGIHWGTKDYAYLRNGMLASGGVGLALLYGVSTHGDVASLALVWWVTAIWAGTRSVFGWIRIWPGVGVAPLRRGGAEPAARV